MHGKSVSPLIRVRKPALSVWYQMLCSQTYGVSPCERKSTAGTSLPSGPGTSWVTSTMYSIAPIESNGGTSYVGSCSVVTPSPQPEWAGPHTAPCRFAHFSVLRQRVGQWFFDSPPGYIWSLRRSRQRWPDWWEPKPETSTSYR